jgi:hypothetical protein
MPNRANRRAERLIDPIDGGSKLRDFDGNLLAVCRTAIPHAQRQATLNSHRLEIRHLKRNSDLYEDELWERERAMWVDDLHDEPEPEAPAPSLLAEHFLALDRAERPSAFAALRASLTSLCIDSGELVDASTGLILADVTAAAAWLDAARVGHEALATFCVDALDVGGVSERELEVAFRLTDVLDTAVGAAAASAAPEPPALVAPAARSVGVV